MAAPLPKTSELHTTLTAYIDAGQIMPEWEAAKIKREIRSIENPVASLQLTALCFGAMGKEDDAIESFSVAMERFYEPRVGINFCTYLKRIGRNTDFLQHAYLFAEQFEDPDLVQTAWESAKVMFDDAKVRTFSRKLRKYYPNEHGENIVTTSEAFIGRLQNLEAELGVKAADIHRLSEACLRIATKYRKSINSSGLGVGEGLAMVCFEVDRCEPDVVSDMNYDLAMEVAELDNLLDIPATAWFRCAAR
ncbi:hypothetical protein [Aeromonas veronii]|uniref:hypothetical protein n=1 Tax=Aeromonas veronii TaxID=654 RepID=UPI001178292B|nr:hypothetical protein [Aeromonas veronii]MBS4690092.1 hypothetical protein [Aeromonas veronii bv. veronii]